MDYSGNRLLSSYIAGIFRRLLRLDYWITNSRLFTPQTNKENRTLTAAWSTIFLAFQNTANAEIGVFILGEFWMSTMLPPTKLHMQFRDNSHLTVGYVLRTSASCATSISMGLCWPTHCDRNWNSDKHTECCCTLSKRCVDLIKVLFLRFWGTHSWGRGGRDTRTDVSLLTKISRQK